MAARALKGSRLTVGDVTGSNLCVEQTSPWLREPKDFRDQVAVTIETTYEGQRLPVTTYASLDDLINWLLAVREEWRPGREVETVRRVTT